MRLLEQVTQFGKPYPVVIFTGGDLLMRKDIFELLEYADRLGLATAVSPAVTPLLDAEVLTRFKKTNVRSMSLSLDGACAETHDSIRGVDGTFERTIGLLRQASLCGLNVQVNTVVMKKNVAQLASIFHLLDSLGVRTWEVFFLIRTGRAVDNDDLSPSEYEDVCNFLYDASSSGFTIRCVEAPFIRRIVLQRNGGAGVRGGELYQKLHRDLGTMGSVLNSPLPTRGTLDGDGIVFVGYDGTIFPGGFVPVKIGNVRESRLSDVYRTSELLVKIRNRELDGKCDRCVFKYNCGGSRARAYAQFGELFGEDPACAYIPAE